uniref:Tumor protein p53 binding protein, 2b n=1 Tax=Sander lucioperca TaxID=283035 RepID=A0A8C9XXM3_SANLU
MFLTVYLSNNEQHFSEVPITPETLCRDVVELCKEPGEADCYLAQVWRGSEHVVGEGERMLEVLQRGGQQRGEVRYLLRHQRAPGPETGKKESGSTHCVWCLQEQRLRQLKDHQEASETERLQQLRENAHNQEAKLRRVRALRGQVEQKRLSNSKLVEEIDQMSGLFQLKQRELLLAVSRVEELSEQLESLRSNRLEPPLPPPPPHLHHHNTSSTAELERLYKELQLRNKLNQDQSGRLQQQRDSLNKRNLEAAAMDRRLAELRQRLWKKKAALQQKENLPVCSDGAAPQHGVGSRVAAVGPYIQSSSTGSQGPPVPARQDLLVKPAYPDGTATLPMPDSALKPPPIPAKPAAGTEQGWVPKNLASDLKLPVEDVRVDDLTPVLGGKALTDQRSLSGSEVPPPVPSRTNHIAENLLRDNQTLGPPPVPSKPKPFSPSGFSTPPYSTGTFPGKARPLGGHLRAPGVLSSHSRTLPLPAKQENPPAAAVRPYTPDPSEAPPPVLQKPQTVAASSIYSMYTQQGKGYQPGGQGTLPRSQPRVYGKPVLPASGGQLSATSDVIHSGSAPDASEVDSSFPANGEGSCSGVVVAETAERATPRPLSPTKLLPFLSHPHRNPTLHHAPRPLKKRSSITEPEGPAGPNIQKLLYQKTTLAAMETIPMETLGPAGVYVPPPEEGTGGGGVSPDLGASGLLCRRVPPLPAPPRTHPAATGTRQTTPPDLQPPEVTGQVAAPPGKKSILRRAGSERTDPSVRVKFNPLALLLDSSLEGEYDLVQRVIYDVDDPSMPNDEGITALHNAVCAGHTEIVKFLVQFGVNANAADSDGWTPLHCAASCNNVQVCKFLVESGAAVFATTHSDMQTAADKCEEMEDGYAQCSQFLYGVQEKMGVMNRGVVYALWDYEPQSEDELGFREGDCMTVLRREDAAETEWWWARCGDHEGYIPRNLLGLYLRIKPRQRSLA